jgi:hypothetical protein
VQVTSEEFKLKVLEMEEHQTTLVMDKMAIIRITTICYLYHQEELDNTEVI